MSTITQFRINNSQVLDRDDPRFRIRPYQQIASSCTGGIITSIFMTPFDVIKTRLQIQQKTIVSKCYLYCNGLMDHICPCGDVDIKAKERYLGLTDAIVKISRQEGVKSLWSGLSPTLVLALPTTIIYFVGYDQIRMKMKDIYLTRNPNAETVPFVFPLIAGGLARVMAVTAANPLELIRTKMQSQRLNYFQVGEAVRGVLKMQGITGMWKGWIPTLYRDVPFSAIYWCMYETIKQHFNVHSSPTFTLTFLGGAISGGVAAFITTPFDVIKTHRQIELGEKLIYGKECPSETRIFHALQQIYRRNGLQGLFAGLTPRLARVAPACAIMISTFEFGKAFFYERNFNRYTYNTD